MVRFINGGAPKGKVFVARTQKLAVLSPDGTGNFYEWFINFDPNYLQLDPQIDIQRPASGVWTWTPQALGQATIVFIGNPRCWKNTSNPCSIPGFEATLTVEITELPVTPTSTVTPTVKIVPLNLTSTPTVQVSTPYP